MPTSWVYPEWCLTAPFIANGSQDLCPLGGARIISTITEIRCWCKFYSEKWNSNCNTSSSRKGSPVQKDQWEKGLFLSPIEIRDFLENEACLNSASKDLKLLPVLFWMGMEESELGIQDCLHGLSLFSSASRKSLQFFNLDLSEKRGSDLVNWCCMLNEFSSCMILHGFICILIILLYKRAIEKKSLTQVLSR